MPPPIRARLRRPHASPAHDGGWTRRCRSARRSTAAWPQTLRAEAAWWRYCRDKRDACRIPVPFYIELLMVSGLSPALTAEAAVATWLASLSLIKRDVGARILRAEIFRAWTNEAVVIELLNHMGGPSADAGNGEDQREKIHIDTESVIGRSRVEVHIGVQLLVGFYELFDLVGDLEPLGLPAGMTQIAGHDAQMGGARIFGVIDAMSEAGDFLFLRQHPFYVVDRVSSGTIDGFQDVEYSFVGPAVERAFQGSDGGSDG